MAGRVALVTGGARGIGAAIVTRFLDEGAYVIVGDVLASEGALLVSESGASARFAPLDVRFREDWETAVELSSKAFGGSPTIVIHNAGVMTPGTALEVKEDALRSAFDVNVVGPVVGSQVCLPGMIEQGGGSIVVVSSIAASSVGPGFIPYAVSKAANAAYARAAARELGPYGVRVNSLHPGGVETPMNSGPAFASLDKAAWFGRMPIPRIGQDREIADAALYLASEESSYVTGTQLVVDGGQLLGPVSGWNQ